MKLAIVKLGGSVITDKSRQLTFNAAIMKQLASEIETALSFDRELRCIIVHGAGSYGHYKAARYRLQGMNGFSAKKHFLEVRNDVRALNHKVIEVLLNAGVEACAVPPENIFRFSNGKAAPVEREHISAFLQAGVMPVTFGDVVYDSTLLLTIVSGDLLMLELSRIFRPHLSIFCTDVDGVYTSNPKLNRGAEMIRNLTPGMHVSTVSSKVLDVTGEMGGKLNTLLDIASHSSRTLVINGLVRGRLKKALLGHDVTGTSVSVGDNK
jgi:isopentenyl phosphate kinase